MSIDTLPRVERGPGYVSIEVPRKERETIQLLEVASGAARPGTASFILGVDIAGEVHWGDFSKPSTCHLLVGGQTGSGKSGFLRQLLCSLAVSSKPEELPIVIVDPKMTDYVDLNGSPFLRCRVIDQIEEAVTVLADLVVHMEARYQEFKKVKVKDLESYNKLMLDEKMPRIIVAFDEFADAMADKEMRKGLETSL